MSAHLHAAEMAASTWGVEQWVGTGLAVISAVFIVLVFAWEKVKHSRFFVWTWKKDPRKRNDR